MNYRPFDFYRRSTPQPRLATVRVYTHAKPGAPLEAFDAQGPASVAVEQVRQAGWCLREPA